MYFNVLFMLAVITDIHLHSFKKYRLVCEMHDNVDLVWGVKIIYELESIINACKTY